MPGVKDHSHCLFTTMLTLDSGKMGDALREMGADRPVPQTAS